MDNDRRLGVGLSSSALKGIGYTAGTAQMGATGAVLGAVVGSLVGGDIKGAGVGGAIGGVVGALFGAFATYEAAQGATS